MICEVLMCETMGNQAVTLGYKNWTEVKSEQA